VYRPGSQSQNADSLSRRACPPACSYCSRREKLSEERAELRSVTFHGAINWAAEQVKDTDLMAMRTWVQQGNKPAWEEVNLTSPGLKSMWREFDRYYLHDDILVRKFFTPQAHYFQIAIPKHKASEIVEVAHSQGHWGVERTKLAIRDKYYWTGWAKEVTGYVKQCEPCNRKKGPPKRQVPTFKKALAGAPME